MFCCFFFFFKQKTAYEMRISDWSSDVCSFQARKMPSAVRCRLLVHPARAAAKCPVCIARPLADGRAETGAPHQLRKALTTEAKRYDLRIFEREGFGLFHFFMCKLHQTRWEDHTPELQTSMRNKFTVLC